MATRVLWPLVSLSLLAPAAGAASRDLAPRGAADAGSGVSELAASGLRKAKRFMLRGGYVAAGVRLRNRGTGTIDIESIAGAEAEAAYLYFTILDDTDPMQAIVDAQGQLGILTFEGTPHYLNAGSDPITRVGRDLSPCWPAAFSFSYRLDVTRHLRRHGPWPAQITLSAFPSGSTSGDPWLDGSLRPMIEGATLVIVYRLTSAPLTEVVIYDGNYLYQAAAAETAVDVHPERWPRKFKTTFIGADGQSIPGPFSLVDGGDVRLPWDGGDPPSPGFFFGNLWDTLTAEGQPLERTARRVTAGLTASTGFYDCVVWVAQVVSVVQDDDDGCSAGFFFGADTNVHDVTGDHRVTIKDFPNELSTPTCHGPEHRDVFYAGRLGSVPPPGFPWTCFIQGVGAPQGSESSCTAFNAEAARVASPKRSYAYWWLLGPPRCRDGVCPLPPGRTDCDGFAGVTVPGVASADQVYARFGACQAEMLYQQARRYLAVTGGNVLFADIEDPRRPEPPVWNPCPADCAKNRAVLQGFLWQVGQRGMIPGVYTTSEFWRVRFESSTDVRYPWDPQVPFVVWLAADRATCKHARDRGLQCFPNTVLGGMRPVVWQYVERSAQCVNDYDVTVQDPTYDPHEDPRRSKPGLRPDPAWGPQPYVVFSRERELSLPESGFKCWVWP